MPVADRTGHIIHSRQNLLVGGWCSLDQRSQCDAALGRDTGVPCRPATAFVPSSVLAPVVAMPFVPSSIVLFPTCAMCDSCKLSCPRWICSIWTECLYAWIFEHKKASKRKQYIIYTVVISCLFCTCVAFILGCAVQVDMDGQSKKGRFAIETLLQPRRSP